jgi:hypothetical protein
MIVVGAQGSDLFVESRLGHAAHRKIDAATARRGPLHRALLRIGVDQKHALGTGEGTGDVQGEGGLAHAALLIQERVNHALC